MYSNEFALLLVEKASASDMGTASTAKSRRWKPWLLGVLAVLLLLALLSFRPGRNKSVQTDQTQERVQIEFRKEGSEL